MLLDAVRFWHLRHIVAVIQFLHVKQMVLVCRLKSRGLLHNRVKRLTKIQKPQMNSLR